MRASESARSAGGGTETDRQKDLQTEWTAPGMWWNHKSLSPMGPLNNNNYNSDDGNHNSDIGNNNSRKSVTWSAVPYAPLLVS